jgi:hypothetical protein
MHMGANADGTRVIASVSRIGDTIIAESFYRVLGPPPVDQITAGAIAIPTYSLCLEFGTTSRLPNLPETEDKDEIIACNGS